jgi:hypothetical protein
MSRRNDKRYKALDHTIRREIVILLAKAPHTYSQLLTKLGIESGHLAYHIRNLNELLDKDTRGNYFLNAKGKQAYDFLTGKTRMPEENGKEGPVLFIVFFLIVFLMGIILFSPTDKIAQIRYEEQKSETIIMLNQSLDMIYEIFEDWEIPRDHWTNLLLNIVNIRSNLENIHALNSETQLKIYSEELDYYESELSNVITVGDPEYFTLTIEKRHLIRELHSLILEIRDYL